MECRKFELTLISANDLEEVRKLFKMKVYARVSIGGNQETEKRTPADRHGEANPAWNLTMKFTVPESCLQHYGAMLLIKLYCKRKLGDRYIGEVYVPMKELFDQAYARGGSRVVDYPVRRGSLNSQGLLRFAYRFGQCVDVEKLVLAEGFAYWQ
ncbi:protein SRC2-like [Diospyros lotus]|uniref:protein SRC2-like n=1 Tax=Diospyros lotus TaxID=55363 RepID=UPI00225B25AE|nr:protein SRC2-like [Diospyros lotus]